MAIPTKTRKNRYRQRSSQGIPAAVLRLALACHGAQQIQKSRRSLCKSAETTTRAQPNPRLRSGISPATEDVLHRDSFQIEVGFCLDDPAIHPAFQHADHERAVCQHHVVKLADVEFVSPSCVFAFSHLKNLIMPIL